MSDGRSLDGRVALVTGGGTGIGLAIATHLAGLGAKVAVAGRRQEPLDAAVARFREGGGEGLAVPMDVRDFDAVSQTLGIIAERFGGLDILVNNAAGNFICATAELSPNGWKAVVDIDLNGTFHCCRAAYALLEHSPFGGRIVNITMGRTANGWPGAAHAAAAKAGVLSLTRTLAVEWGPVGIRCNAVAPGLTADTEGVQRLFEAHGRARAELEGIPLGRFAHADEIGAMVAYLCGPGGDYVNGAEILIDGGRALSRVVGEERER